MTWGLQCSLINHFHFIILIKGQPGDITNYNSLYFCSTFSTWSFQEVATRMSFVQVQCLPSQSFILFILFFSLIKIMQQRQFWVRQIPTIKYEVDNINILRILSKYFITVCFFAESSIKCYCYIVEWIYLWKQKVCI